MRKMPVIYIDGWLLGKGWSRKATLIERIRWNLGLLRKVRP